MTSVTKLSSRIYNKNGEPIYNKNSTTQTITQNSDTLYVVAHAFHVFQKDHFFNTASYWSNKKNDPFLYKINDIEAIDVDTEDDFFIPESVYKKYRSIL